MDLILTARQVDAIEALRIGLANRVVPPGRALEAAIDLARSIAELPQQAVRHMRLSALEQWGLDEAAAAETEARHSSAAILDGLAEPLRRWAASRNAGKARPDDNDPIHG